MASNPLVASTEHSVRTLVASSYQFFQFVARFLGVPGMALMCPALNDRRSPFDVRPFATRPTFARGFGGKTWTNRSPVRSARSLLVAMPGAPNSFLSVSAEGLCGRCCAHVGSRRDWACSSGRSCEGGGVGHGPATQHGPQHWLLGWHWFLYGFTLNSFERLFGLLCLSLSKKVSLWSSSAFGALLSSLSGEHYDGVFLQRGAPKRPTCVSGKGRKAAKFTKTTSIQVSKVLLRGLCLLPSICTAISFQAFAGVVRGSRKSGIARGIAILVQNAILERPGLPPGAGLQSKAG